MIESFLSYAQIIIIIGAPWALATLPFLHPRLRSWLLGPQRQRAVSWGGIEVLAILFFVAITPPVYAVNYAADSLITKVSHQEPVKHPFDEITQQVESKAEWVLVGLAVLFVAPVYEELFFRGILQGWLGQKTWGGFGAFLIA